MRVATLALIFCFSFIAVAQTPAGSDETLTVNIRIPEAFHVGNLSFEPGMYTFEHDPGSSMLTMRTAQGQSFQFPMRTLDTAPPRESSATLIKTAGTYYLDKIWIAGKPFGFDIGAATKPSQVASYDNDSPDVLKKRPVNSTPDNIDRPAEPAQPMNRLEREIRHELVMLPYLSIFDNLSFRVADGTVTLMGQVTKPVLKDDAEHAVKRIEGVEQVVNQIQVLPPSPAGDRIRAAEYHAIYGNPALSRYGMGAIPPIHIIVDNGRVTLTGVVDSESDKNLAGIQANSVPGVFSVQNELRVAKP